MRASHPLGAVDWDGLSASDHFQTAFLNSVKMTLCSVHPT